MTAARVFAAPAGRPGSCRTGGPKVTGVAPACSKPRSLCPAAGESWVRMCVCSCTPSMMWPRRSVNLVQRLASAPISASQSFSAGVLRFSLAACVPALSLSPWRAAAAGGPRGTTLGHPGCGDAWVPIFPHSALSSLVSGVRHTACDLAVLPCAFNIQGWGAVL